MSLFLFNILNSLALPINFICHGIMFMGGLYIAIHSRIIPTWLTTCLWYIGCSSFLVATTIILDWIFGPNFELSYSNIGFYGEIFFNILVASTTLVFFLKTIVLDIFHSKHRKK